MSEARVPVRWEGSNASTSYANVFELSADRSEVTLSFGSKGRRVPGTDELVLEVSDRIVLSPSTAKRLAAMLAQQWQAVKSTSLADSMAKKR